MGKYKARKATADGITFDSKKERDRYCQLKLMERAGEIKNLELQPKFKLIVDGKPLLIKSDGYPNGRKATYTADFRYLDKNIEVVEDVKSPATKTYAYKLKKALVEAIYDVVIIEV